MIKWGGPRTNEAGGDNSTDGQEGKWKRNRNGDRAMREVREKNIEEKKF